MTPELREMLELSAKAMGYEPIEPRDNFITEYLLCRHECLLLEWHPHTSWHQCSKMECELGISFLHERRSIDVESYLLGTDISFRELLSDNKHDRATARMMASLKVAAEIGKRLADNPVSLKQQEK